MLTTYPKEIPTSELTKVFNKIDNLSSLDVNKFILTHKKYEVLKQNHKSTLNLKIKNQNIKKTKFGIDINIRTNFINDLLCNNYIIKAKLSFYLNNLSKEINSLYLINSKNNNDNISYFNTHDDNTNCIDLDIFMSEIQEKIINNENICFFIPIFNTYDDYEDFHHAITNVTLSIEYLE